MLGIILSVVISIYLGSFYSLETIISNSGLCPLNVTKYCRAVQKISQSCCVITAALPGFCTSFLMRAWFWALLFPSPLFWLSVSNGITIIIYLAMELYCHGQHKWCRNHQEIFNFLFFKINRCDLPLLFTKKVQIENFDFLENDLVQCVRFLLIFSQEETCSSSVNQTYSCPLKKQINFHLLSM